MYKLPTAILVLLSVALTLWWMNAGKFNVSERSLITRLETVLADAPPLPAKITTEFELPEACTQKSCFFKGSKLAEATYADGSLRPSREGIVFVLEDFGGQCIRAKTVADRFGPSAVNQACAHGGCWYREVQYGWGLLAFGLEKSDSACVSSVVINGLPQRRPAH